MSDLAEEWDAVPVSQSPATRKTALADEWDAIPVSKDSSTPAEKRQGIVDAAKRAIINVNPLGAAENGVSAVTGMAGQVMGGLYGAGARLTGDTADEAAAKVRSTAEALTYQPRTVAGKNLFEITHSPYNPMNYAAEAGDYLGDKTLDITGSPAAAATVSTATNAVGNVLAGMFAGKLAGKADTRFGAKPEAALLPATEITPQMIRGQEPIPEHLIESQPTPTMPVQKEQVTVGAQPAAIQTTKEAPPITLENASPELKQAIKPESGQLSPDILQRHLEADALPVPISLTKGQATGDLAQLSDEFNMRAKQPELAKRFNEQNGQLIENVNAIRDRISPDVTDTNHVDNGAALIESYKTLQTAREAEVNANYKALADANNGAIPVDGKAFAASAQKALGDGLVNYREFLPANIERIVDRIGSSEQQMTFDDFTTLRTVLAKSARSAEDGNARHAISIVRNQLEDIPMAPEAAALKPLADTAKNSARALFQDIESDPAWDAAINGKVPPDNFVKKFVINGPRDTVARMKANIGSDPIANQTIGASALNYLKERAGTPNDSGNFSQAGYNKALNALRPKLDSLFDPVAAQQVETLGKVARYVQEQPRGSYFNNSNTFVSAAKGTAKAAVEGALNLKTFGLSGSIKNAVDAGRQNKAATEALKPGAGVKLSDIPKG